MPKPKQKSRVFPSHTEWACWGRSGNNEIIRFSSIQGFDLWDNRDLMKAKNAGRKLAGWCLLSSQTFPRSTLLHYFHQNMQQMFYQTWDGRVGLSEEEFSWCLLFFALRYKCTLQLQKLLIFCRHVTFSYISLPFKRRQVQNYARIVVLCYIVLGGEERILCLLCLV